MIMRGAIQLFAGLCLAGALVAVAIQPAAWPMLVGAGLLALGTFGERFYYRGGTVTGTGGTWQATAERFLDEESGQLVTVWFNPATGERRYVEQGGSPPA